MAIFLTFLVKNVAVFNYHWESVAVLTFVEKNTVEVLRIDQNFCLLMRLTMVLERCDQ